MKFEVRKTKNLSKIYVIFPISEGFRKILAIFSFKKEKQNVL